ncbi:N-acetylmuramoyl-L-alanine amidase [Nocardioides sp.]|uniref:N-acetylmuramoyl-L-alanine amidase n=1 Tax=Nocardioides sp. TaxID=35761 RepID=UPI001A2B9D1A|nr:N-acetylmuramoyl-L-alanine amidase [Nocardioides sp.]MBJ7358442.1 N-acetylmuramoyl-L-alanine amidase [Nocardioides sp.]
MRPSRRAYIAVCQRLLALGVVVVALVPAAGVVSLDVVGVAPTKPVVPRQPVESTVQAPAQGRSPGAVEGVDEQLRDYAVETTHESEVPTAPVDPVVREVSLTPKAQTAAEQTDQAEQTDPADQTDQAEQTDQADQAGPAERSGQTEVLSDPQTVTGLGAVGVTWDGSTEVADDAIAIQVRTETDGAWSEWSDLTYHEEHGPDPDSAEAAQARPGTDGTVVGDVDQVQVKVEMADGELPADLTLAVVDPGTATATEEEAPEIDTADLATPPTGAQAEAEPPVVEAPGPDVAGEPVADEAIALQATTVTPKPVIYSRAQWGADESKRDGKPSYFEVHGGFVHHTVNANDYKREDVPAIIRSIYAYHTQSRGWSDIGYNFLVDRFGRIWEGRYGGVDRAVVGAHTLNYNSYSFAMSAIGNFELVQPPTEMIQAYAALMAWKLSLHGVSAASTIQRIGSKNFQAINGHRDAASTACPGRYLYAQIPEIRRLAALAQADWSGRDPQPNLVGSPAPDLVARRISDSQAVILPIEPTATGVSLGTPVETGLSLKRADLVLSVGDWDRDGFNDIATRSKKGAVRIRRGDGAGGFGGPPIRLGTSFKGFSMLAAVGDMTGDGYPDLMGQPAGSGVHIYAGGGTAGLAAAYKAYGKMTGSQLVGVGRLDGDGAPDVMVRNGNVLTAWAGNGPGGLTGALPISVDVTRYDWVVGVGDVGLTGSPDLVVRKAGKGRLSLLQWGPTGFAAPVKMAGGMKAYDLVG